jgi:hypothetical protein
MDFTYFRLVVIGKTNAKRILKILAVIPEPLQNLSIVNHEFYPCSVTINVLYCNSPSLHILSWFKLLRRFDKIICCNNFSNLDSISNKSMGMVGSNRTYCFKTFSVLTLSNFHIKSGHLEIKMALNYS